MQPPPLPVLLALVSVSAMSQLAANPDPTFADVAYGKDERMKVDLWQAEGDGPRPLLIYIHGGGWTKGDKRAESRVKPDYKKFLEKGISCAAFNYRLAPKDPLPAPVHDAARAIQFLRSKAQEWNLRKDRFVLTGGSAGGCTAMWLLCHDDLGDPRSFDELERESTRVQGAVIQFGQTSIDPPQIEEWLGPKVLEHRMIHMAVGEETMADATKNYRRHKKIFQEFSPINHVSADDPPLAMSYSADMTLPSKSGGHGIHHPVYGVKMKEKCDEVGQECHLFIKGVSDSDKYANPDEFLFDLLLAP